MGRMKEIYIDLMNKYGEIPENFSFEKWRQERDLEQAERQKILSDRKEMDERSQSNKEESSQHVS
jgi:hypothetical protein